MTRSVIAFSRTMSSRKGRSRLLVCCFCKFQTRSKGGFAWHQTVLHGRSGGNGIPGLKRRRSTELSENGKEAEEGGSANVSARPLTRPRSEAPETLAAATSGAAGGGVEGNYQQPPRASQAGNEAVFGTGALAPDDVGSYNTAIRDEMYPLLAMTTGEQPGLEQNGGGAPVGELHLGGRQGSAGYEYQTLATQLRCMYEVLDDAARAVPIALRVKRSRAGQFNTTRLRALQQFVLGVGGAGLSVREQRLLYNFLDVWDRQGPNDATVDDDNLSLRAVFPTRSSFTNALRDDLNQAVLDAGWKKLRLQEGGVMYEAYFRSVLDVAVDELHRRADKVRLWSGESGPAPPSTRREAPQDGDAFRLCEQEVVGAHGGTSFVLGLHMYSDSSQLSWSGGKFLCSFFCETLPARLGRTPLLECARACHP